MKIKKVFIALCASALFFNVNLAFGEKNIIEEKYVFDSNGFPYINFTAICFNDPSVGDLLKRHTDTSNNVMCLSYMNDTDQFVVTFPIQINTEHVVFVFKVYPNNCFGLVSQACLKKDDIPFICCEDGLYKIITCCE
ncbi:hypothetical protein IT403_03455 [Candidatus Nomurabacteria bacterium]|nr:hypothetical protein [Candidatus Nomurabacteria bacterium]